MKINLNKKGGSGSHSHVTSVRKQAGFQALGPSRDRTFLHSSNHHRKQETCFVGVHKIHKACEQFHLIIETLVKTRLLCLSMMKFLQGNYLCTWKLCLVDTPITSGSNTIFEVKVLRRCNDVLVWKISLHF
ncbi:hypothetical protein Peur_051521 [Populus x canadensis]